MEKYIEIFNKLWEHSENEVVEFKKAETNFDIDELGKYFSALSNEANLRDHEFAWIVFGVWDKKHQIIGTTFKDGEVALNRLKQDMSQHTTGNLIFRDIVPLDIEGKRVLLFQIPASPRNIVMHWKGVAYGRDGESLKPLNQAKQDTIRQQPPIPDWTAQLVPNATINDLDELAVATAKVMFKKVRSSSIPAEEIDAEQFIAQKSFKAKGKRLTTWKIESIEELEPTRFPEPPSEDNDEEPDGSDSENEGENLDPDAGKSEQQVIDELTGQTNLFSEKDFEEDQKDKDWLSKQ